MFVKIEWKSQWSRHQTGSMSCICLAWISGKANEFTGRQQKISQALTFIRPVVGHSSISITSLTFRKPVLLYNSTHSTLLQSHHSRPNIVLIDGIIFCTTWSVPSFRFIIVINSIVIHIIIIHRDQCYCVAVATTATTFVASDHELLSSSSSAKSVQTLKYCSNTLAFGSSSDRRFHL